MCAGIASRGRDKHSVQVNGGEDQLHIEIQKHFPSRPREAQVAQHRSATENSEKKRQANENERKTSVTRFETSGRGVEPTWSLLRKLLLQSPRDYLASVKVQSRSSNVAPTKTEKITSTIHTNEKIAEKTEK